MFRSAENSGLVKICREMIPSGPNSRCFFVFFVHIQSHAGMVKYHALFLWSKVAIQAWLLNYCQEWL